VPLSLFATTTGTHTFTFNGIEDFPQTTIIWLEDLKTGTIQYLRQNNMYVFNSTVGDEKDRFVIHFSPELLVITTPSNCAGSNGAVTLSQRGGIEWAFRLKDENDGVVTSEVFNSIEVVDRLAPGAYTIELTHPTSGYATTVTVVIDGQQPVGPATIGTSVTQVLENETFTLDAAAANAVFYTWDMGDGNVIINQQSITHAYAQEGTYNVMMIASNYDSCDAVAITSITVKKEEAVSTGIAPVEEGSIRVYASGYQLFIVQRMQKGDADAQVEVFNNLGQRIHADRNAVLMHSKAHITTIRVPAGLYFVKVTMGDKETISKVHLGE
jgi:hypothetical protein